MGGMSIRGKQRQDKSKQPMTKKERKIKRKKRKKGPYNTTGARYF